MNYTMPDNRPFITNKPLQTKMKLSDEAKAMGKYFDSHYFSVTLDADSHTPVVKVIKKNDEK